MLNRNSMNFMNSTSRNPANPDRNKYIKGYKCNIKILCTIFMTKVSFFISKILLVLNRNVYPTTKEVLPWKIQTSSLELISIPIQKSRGASPLGILDWN